MVQRRRGHIVFLVKLILASLTLFISLSSTAQVKNKGMVVLKDMDNGVQLDMVLDSHNISRIVRCNPYQPT